MNLKIKHSIGLSFIIGIIAVHFILVYCLLEGGQIINLYIGMLFLHTIPWAFYLFLGNLILLKLSFNEKWGLLFTGFVLIVLLINCILKIATNFDYLAVYHAFVFLFYLLLVRYWNKNLKA